MTDDIVQWLGAQLDEDERIAREATGLRWGACDKTMPYLISDVDAYRSNRTLDSTIGRVAVAEAPEDRRHIVAQDPARVLREIDAKREIVRQADLYLCDAGPGCGYRTKHGHNVLRLLALPYADRPGYREEWRP